MINEMDKQQFLATFDARMRFIEAGDESVPPIKIGDYVGDCITALSLPTDRKDVDIHKVYMNDAKGFCHILLNWGVENTYLVIVTKPFEGTIHGHYLLDLTDEYGLTTGNESGHCPIN